MTMSSRDTVLSTLPPEVRDTAEAVYQELSEQAPPDPRDVVAELHRRGALRDDQLRDAMIALEGSLRIDRVRAEPPPTTEPTVLGPLGAGAMGEVLIGRDEGLNRIVAVKRLRGEMAGRPRVLERFYKEAQITAQLDHPGIVPIYGLVADPQMGLSYAMKLVRGETLEDYLEGAREQWRRSGGESGDHALTARLERFLQVCAAMAYAHDRGVLHRDLKPENIMVGSFGQVVVMDWGLAKLLDAAPEPADDGADPLQVDAGRTHQTRVGTVMGTPRYMSPEQAQGRTDTMDPRSDQYTLGLILFEVVTLKAAIAEHLDLEACLAWAAEGRKQPIGHLNRKGRVPRELAAIIDKATETAPDRRYASVTDLADDIRRYLRDESVQARPDSLGQRLHRWVGRHRSLMVMLLLASMLVTVVVASGLMVAGVAAHEYRRYRAAAREAALATWMARTGQVAHDIDGQVRRVESLLTGLSFTAARALNRPANSHIELSFDPMVDPPAHLKDSSLYGRPIAADRSSFAFDTDANPASLADDVDHLAASSFQLYRVVVESAGRSVKDLKRGRHKLIGEKGVPVTWARIATERGILMIHPGLGPPEGVSDPTKHPWYRAAEKAPGIVWTGPSIDPLGRGAVVTGSLAAHADHNGKLLGVASVDLVLDTFGDRLSRGPKHTEGIWLVDRSGALMAWPDMASQGMDAWPDKELPHADLKAGIVPGKEGWVEAGGRIAWFAPIPALGWSLVVVADDSVVQ